MAQPDSGRTTVIIHKYTRLQCLCIYSVSGGLWLLYIGEIQELQELITTKLQLIVTSFCFRSLCLHICYGWTLGPFPLVRTAWRCALPLAGAHEPPLLPWDQPAFPADKVVPTGDRKRGVLPPHQTKASPSDTCIFLLPSPEPRSGGAKSIAKVCGGRHTTFPHFNSLLRGDALVRPCWKRPSLGKGQCLG